MRVRLGRADRLAGRESNRQPTRLYHSTIACSDSCCSPHSLLSLVEPSVPLKKPKLCVSVCLSNGLPDRLSD